LIHKKEDFVIDAGVCCLLSSACHQEAVVENTDDGPLQDIHR
jgi:hypothetical protein